MGYELHDELRDELLVEENSNTLNTTTSTSTFGSLSDNDDELNSKIKDMLATDSIICDEKTKIKPTIINNDPDTLNATLKKSQSCTANFFSNKDNDSGLYLYVDFHGHASKKGL